MPVVINELEVVPREEAPAAPAEVVEAVVETPQPSVEEQVERTLAIRRERAERLRAD
jgi:hypothetical protein